ncbi:glycosyltransferase [Georgenia muralis]
MRIVQVSAHYPPNFVSGGTLVPQRIAQAMAGRGHEVRVYAGLLDDTQVPGHAFEEERDGGRVRWIVTTPWTAWTDRHNFDNPAVLADFTRWVGQVRPDVVHLHSLQTLGGGLVTAARAAGARVVVTMHDFWWFDARQFLVDAQMRPTALVTVCSSQRASDLTPAIRGREEWLVQHLDAADLVLAPSEPAARVLAANGVDPERLRMDENGIDVLDATRVPRAGSEGPVRLMFAGGPDPMKGVDVLLDALGRLRADGSWSIDLFGVPEHRVRGLGQEVHARPAYRPEGLAQVLAEHDVLVLPSVMRESHSILTREALSAGLAVITSDCLGPEAVVEDGRNGFVFPTNDAPSLAAAVRRVAGDRALLAELQENARGVGVRALSDQLDGLEALYAGTDGRGRSAPSRWRPGHVLFVTGIQGAPLRYRAHLPSEALTMLGVRTEVRHYRDPSLPDLVRQADAVVFYRVPATSQVLDLIGAIRERDEVVPVIFDVDDLIFDPELEGQLSNLQRLSDEEYKLWWRGVARYRTTMEQADLYVGSTTTLCAEATRATGLPSRRFANGVGVELARVSDTEALRPRRPGPLRLGYFSGTTTHDQDWAAVEPAVIEILRRHPEVELILGGHLSTTAALAEFSGRVRRLPMQPWYRLPAVLRDIDVCLAPLEDASVFNEAKSAIKWLEAALVGTPTVASPTEPFREAVDHGRTGMLANTPEEWVACIDTLLSDEALRALMGARARRKALLTWSPHLQGRRYLDIIADARDVRLAGGERGTSGWTPVFDDEPFSGADAWVEPYEVPASTGALVDRVRGSRLGGLIVAARRTYRSDGLAGVALRARLRMGRTFRPARR